MPCAQARKIDYLQRSPRRSLQMRRRIRITSARTARRACAFLAGRRVQGISQDHRGHPWLLCEIAIVDSVVNLIMLNSDVIQFAPGSLFYDSVMSFQAAMTGALAFHPRVRFSCPDPIGLASTIAPGGAVHFPPNEIRERFHAVGFDLSKIVAGFVAMLINSTYEIANAQYGPELHRFGEELEFFRHLRNAASHGSRWHFKNGEPRRIARWRDKQLTATLHGDGIWSAGITEGDLFFLLHDVDDRLTSGVAD